MYRANPSRGPEGTCIMSASLGHVWVRESRVSCVTIRATLESVTLHLEVDVLGAKVNLIKDIKSIPGSHKVSHDAIITSTVIISHLARKHLLYIIFSVWEVDGHGRLGGQHSRRSAIDTFYCCTILHEWFVCQCRIQCFDLRLLTA